MQQFEHICIDVIWSRFIFSHCGQLSLSDAATSEKLSHFIIAAYMLVLNNIFYKQDCFEQYTLKNTCWQVGFVIPLNYTPISSFGNWQ